MRKIVSLLIVSTMLFCVPLLSSAENGPFIPGNKDGMSTGYWAKHYESKGLYGMDVRAEKQKYYDGQFFFILIFTDDKENYGSKYTTVTDNEYNIIYGEGVGWNHERSFSISVTKSQACQIRFMVEVLCDEAPWEFRGYYDL